MTTNAIVDVPMQPSNNADPSARFWDGRARKYANSKIGDNAGYENTLARARQLLSTDHEVVEIGCGTGTTALHHAPYVGHITGTDISPEMIAIANEKTAENRQLNAEFIVAPADDLPFAPASFDVAMSHNLFHLVGDLDAALAAAHRVLKKGGLFISKTPCLADMNPGMRFVVLPVMKMFYRVPHLGMFSAEQFRSSITKAGFDITDVEYHGTKGKDIRPFIIARKI